jgi:hypothetical protein
MQTFSPRKEVLPLAQQQLWPKLHPTADLGLVLYGGTAIALRVGHRQSVDFDFFTDKPLDKPLLRQEMPFLNDCIVLQDQVDTLTVQTSSGHLTDSPVKISFFGSLHFGRVGEPEITDDGVVQIASLPDLLATKLKVIFQRVEAKDYQDIATILRAGAPLESGLAAARQMFGNAFQPAECLRALVYFKGGDLETLDQTDRQMLVESAARVKELPDSPIVSKELSLPAYPTKITEPEHDLDHDPWDEFGR